MIAAPRRMIERPFAYCCAGDPKGCSCVNPSHGTALFGPVRNSSGALVKGSGL